MVDSKKLKKLTDKLENVDTALGYLNSGTYCKLSIEGGGKVAEFGINLSPDSKAACDLSNQIGRALSVYRENLERQIKSAVRP
jgi:hypothetical protein